MSKPSSSSRAARKGPGILAIHQDGGRRPYQFGKSEPAGLGGDPELAYGLELCLRGYVVICPDRFPFESRSLANSPFKETFAQFPIYTRYYDEKNELKENDLSEDLYRGCVAGRLLFEGRTFTGLTIHELRRAVDCLREQPEVDRDRIGVIGHSGGGYYGTLLMYVDPRVKVGCVSCGTSLFRWDYGGERLRPMAGFGSNSIPGLAQWGDLDDILAGLGPRPFLEIRGDLKWCWPPDSKSALTTKAKARYAELGVPERFRYEGYQGGHEFRKDKRRKAYAWLDRWLEK